MPVMQQTSECCVRPDAVVPVGGHRCSAVLGTKHLNATCDMSLAWLGSNVLLLSGVQDLPIIVRRSSGHSCCCMLRCMHAGLLLHLPNQALMH
jgi:hypothetical protein